MRSKILSAIAVAAVATCAQGQGLRGVQVHAGVALPVGKFAGDRENKYIENGHGRAATGFNLGVKLYVPVYSVLGLSVVAELDGFYNGLQSGYMEEYVDEVEEGGGEVTPPRHLNVPLTVGLSYAYFITGNLQLYAEAGAGASLSKITNSTYEGAASLVATYSEIGGAFGDDNSLAAPTFDVTINNTIPFILTESYQTSFSFTYGLEVGLVVAERVSVGVRYSNLGEHRYKYTGTYDYTLPKSGKELYSDVNGSPELVLLKFSDGRQIEVENSSKTSYSTETEGFFTKKLPVGNVSVTLGILF